MTISSSNPRAALAFLPFFYLVTTRLKSLRDVGYLIVTSWLPPIWILLRIEHLDPVHAVTGFLLGYLAFVCVYEMGYLVNDAWDAARHREGRQRTPFAPTSWSLILFTVIRVAGWLAIAMYTGWLYEPLWLAPQAALIAAMALHNWIATPALRLATFSQLAVLRYCLPVAALLSPAGWVAALIAALLLYLPLRLLAYADSKSLITMPERRWRWFPTAYLAASLPILALAAAVLSLGALVEIWLMLVVAHAGWAMLAGQANGAKR